MACILTGNKPRLLKRLTRDLPSLEAEAAYAGLPFLGYLLSMAKTEAEDELGRMATSDVPRSAIADCKSMAIAHP